MLWSKLSFETTLPITSVGNEIERFGIGKNMQIVSYKQSTHHWVLTSVFLPRLRSFFDLEIEARNSAVSGAWVQIKVVPKTWFLLTLLTTISFASYILWDAYSNFMWPDSSISGGLSGKYQFLRTWPILISFLLPYYYSLAKTKIILDLKNSLIPDYLDTIPGRIEMYESYSSLFQTANKVSYYAYMLVMGVVLIFLILYAFGWIDIADLKEMKFFQKK